MPQVSIIVPIYNAEKYIEDCIKSVFTQSYKDWELLLINDGSSDGSAELCDQLASTDSRIKVVHKPNTGVSDTRNHGLDIASGEYVIFLDADDYWVDNTALERMYSLAKTNNLDVIRGEYKAVDEFGKDLFQTDFMKDRKTVANRVMDSADFFKHVIYGEFFLVLSLFRKSSIGTVRLNVGQIFLEDMRFYSQLLQESLRCMYVPICFYAYRKNTSSVSFKFNQKKLADSFDMCDFFHECANVTSNQVLKSCYNYYSVMLYKWTLETVSLDGYFEKRHSIIAALKLDDLCHRIRRWMQLERIDVNKLIFHMKPIMGIYAFRFKGKLIQILYTLKKKININ